MGRGHGHGFYLLPFFCSSFFSDVKIYLLRMKNGMYCKMSQRDLTMYLDSDSEDESESEGSGSGSGADLDFFAVIAQFDLYVLGLSVNVVIKDMVSGKDDTDDVSSTLVFFFVFDL